MGVWIDKPGTHHQATRIYLLVVAAIQPPNFRNFPLLNAHIGSVPGIPSTVDYFPVLNHDIETQNGFTALGVFRRTIISLYIGYGEYGEIYTLHVEKQKRIFSISRVASNNLLFARLFHSFFLHNGRPDNENSLRRNREERHSL